MKISPDNSFDLLVASIPRFREISIYELDILGGDPGRQFGWAVGRADEGTPEGCLILCSGHSRVTGGHEPAYDDAGCSELWGWLDGTWGQLQVILGHPAIWSENSFIDLAVVENQQERPQIEGRKVGFAGASGARITARCAEVFCCHAYLRRVPVIQVYPSPWQAMHHLGKGVSRNRENLEVATMALAARACNQGEGLNGGLVFDSGIGGQSVLVSQDEASAINIVIYACQQLRRARREYIVREAVRQIEREEAAKERKEKGRAARAKKKAGKLGQEGKP